MPCDPFGRQGVCAIEFLEDAPEIEALIVPIGGGGLIAGCAIAAKAMKNGGKAMYKNVAGGTLTFAKKGKGWQVWDAKGGHADITIANVMQSNGVIHVIDTVLMP